MVLWIGVDDTDSLRGMCTTFLATELVRDLTEDHDLIGFPRLVRLNPNVPWKTRGNGAVCLRVGKGFGKPRSIGQIGGREIIAYPQAAASTPDFGPIADRVASLVERWACMDDETTNPGFVVLRRSAPPGLYWRAVRGILSKQSVLDSVQGFGVVRGYKEGRGLIGAVAATAWRPRDRTYEVLTYRNSSCWGTPRSIDPDSVIAMDRSFSSTFNNYDFENRRVVIAPRSPCPILFGIRGDDPVVLPRAMEMIQGERPERWLVFETNQGTDDHVIAAPPTDPCTTVRFRGIVTSAPRTLRGGHVVFSVDEYPISVYEPSKGFRDVVRHLMPGDSVQVIGAVRNVPRTINLEKLRVEFLALVTRKVQNPMCSPCGKRMKSKGRGRGFRCRRCHRQAPAGAADYAVSPRSLSPGWYEPPVGSRRHLSRPLSRLGGPFASRSDAPKREGAPLLMFEPAGKDAGPGSGQWPDLVGDATD